MRPSIGIRRETKSPWERRCPVTPALARRLVESAGIDVLIQPSARRVFPDGDFTRAGARLVTDIGEANVVLGVKEVPPEQLTPGATYLFFAHVVKGQPPNMPMLRRIMELGCTLVDYEKIVDDQGRRLVFFGRFAGLAGMVDSLWALGRRLAGEAIRTPLAQLEPAHAYPGLEEAKAAVRRAGDRIASSGLPEGLPPVVIGIAGYGNVARGVREILAELPTREVAPADLGGIHASPSRNCIYQTTFTEQDIVAPRDPGAPFELTDYYGRPERYRSTFERFLPHLTVLMNCNYWDARYPRLVTVDELRRLYSGEGRPRLRVIGDIGCDVGGAVECNVRATGPADPVYVYDVATGAAEPGFNGNGPAVLAVDILPAELPVEASEEFAKALAPILPILARADFGRPLEALEVPPEIGRAIIVHRGQLTPAYAYLEQHLQTALVPG
ncbi:MAG: bifunctional lysine ketoglutarate reductase /saccharopine dehydrogenase family protein [Thermoanaerobaculales bacterium]|jgi:alpha-aminoadipic semialdehyde synthase|nr:bifunctional lysine ketoglutarate reductase /saccharopine dehydrogenase family protein [Thermoanaerobaculales bacterium]